MLFNPDPNKQAVEILLIGIMKKLSLFLSRKTLLAIYKSFVRPNLDYADIIYDKPFN